MLKRFLRCFAPWRNRWEAHCTVCALAVIVCFVGTSLYVTSKIDYANNPPNCGTDNCISQTDYWERWLDPIALLTLILAASTAYLGCSTRGLVILARDEFRASHPPHISVKHVWLKSDILSGEAVKIRIEIRNVGESNAKFETARIGSIGILIELAGRQLPQPDVVNDSKTIPKGELMVQGNDRQIGPGGTLAANEIVISDGLSATDIAAITGQTSYLYCFGSIDYLGLDGRRRKTAYCYRLEPPHPTLVPVHRNVGRFFPLDPRDPDYQYED